MRVILKNIGLKFGRAMLALCAFLLIAAMALQILLSSAVNLAATGAGTDFLEGKINAALKQSGYEVSFDSMVYDPVRGITLQNLAISDASGLFLTLDRFSLYVSLMSLPMRELKINGQGGTLTILRAPVSVAKLEDEPDSAPSPFTLPDFYIRQAAVFLSFEKIMLSEDITGRPLTFSPSLSAHAFVHQTASLQLELKPGLDEIVPGIAGPDLIALEGSFDPEQLFVSIEEFEMMQDDYAINAAGTGQFTAGGQLDFALQAKHDDLSALTGTAIESFAGALMVKGPQNGPAIGFEGKLIPLSLKDKGLGDIGLSFSMQDISKGMKGHLKIDTVFKEEPVALESELSYEAPILTIASIEGTAPELKLTGSGNFSTETNLFDGELAMMASDLSHYEALVAADIAGNIEAAAKFEPDGTKQAMEAELEIRKAKYETYAIGDLKASARFNTLPLPWPQSADLKARDLRIGDETEFSAVSGTLEQASGGRYRLLFKGNGTAPVAVSFEGGALLSDLAQPVPTANDIDLTARLGQSSVRLSGAFAPEALELVLTAKDFRSTDLPAALPDALSKIRFTTTAKMIGPPNKPRTDIDLRVTGLGSRNYQNATLLADMMHDGKTVRANLNGQGTGIRRLHATASFPMALSMLPFQWGMDKNAALSGKMDAGIDLAALSEIFLPPTQSLTGSLTLNGTIGGTVSAPAPVAALHVENARFEDDSNGIELAALTASAALTKDGLVLKRLDATDGREGTLGGSGSIAFSSTKNSNIALTMRRFNVPRTNMANGLIDADLSVAGSKSGLDFTGQIDIAEMDILIPETFQSRIPELNIIERREKQTAPFSESISLDIQIDAPQRIFVRGWGLDAEFGGEIDISGQADAPQFNGTLSAKRGRYEEFGKRFALDRANLRFQGEIPPSPYLDIEATIPTDDVTAAILLTGPAKSPSIDFSSVPALPRDEVLSRILFGKESSKISPFQAIQLAQTIQRFSGKGGGFDPLSMLRSTTGLDDISIETDESGETNVGVGKYITDRVYLELEKGNAENSGAAVIQLEVTPSVNVESRVGQDAQTGGGVLWKHDY